MEKKYKSKRFVDRLRWVIVDDNGKVINNNPSKDELKTLERFPEKNMRGPKIEYTDEQLKNKLRLFYKKYGRPPTVKDFVNDAEYPCVTTYVNRFGSWVDALKLVGLDVDSMVKRGVLVTNNQKGRNAEVIVRDHFKVFPVDLAGEDSRSSCDGICPNGMNYEVKSSKLHSGLYYQFHTRNKYKEEIEIYYFLAFNKDWTKLMYGWRVPGEIVEREDFSVSINSWSRAKFTVENMKQYDITGKLRDVLGKY